VNGNTHLQIDGRDSGTGGNDPMGISAVFDPSGTLLQGPTSSVDGNTDNNPLSDTTESTFNMLFGDAGDDTLLGSNGADFLIGGAGSDSVSGGQGNDILVYGINDAKLDGGTGIDILRIDDGALSFFNNIGTTKTVTGADTQPDTVKEVDLRTANITNMEVLLITDDQTGDAHKGTMLVLSAQDVLNFTDGNDKLYVQGSPGDQIRISDTNRASWTGGNAGNDNNPNTAEILSPVSTTAPDSQGQSWDVYTTTSGGTLYVDHDSHIQVVIQGS
jgi:hypothetical protein